MLKIKSRILIFSIIGLLILGQYLPNYNVTAEAHTITLYTSLTGNHSVDNAGDVNGDGYDDVLVGAHENIAYIYYGGKNMDNVADVILEGEAPDDYFGWTLSGAGDVNGDGYSDVIVGAILNDRNGENWGSAYVFFGGENMDNVSDVIMAEESGFGGSVSGAGDLNNDGFDDIIIGAPNYSTWHDNNQGKVYIYFGGNPMDSKCDLNLTGNYKDRLGIDISQAGDVNNDGFSDIVVGTDSGDILYPKKGKAYVCYGGNPMDLMNYLKIENNSYNDSFGTKVSSAGDINKDGYDDILIGALKYNGSGLFRAGAAHLLLGGDSMDNVSDLVLQGETYAALFGISLSEAGDINNDGYDDFLIGADEANYYGYQEGAVYIYYGNNSIDELNRTIIMNDGYSMDGFGIGVSTAGDINNDGYDDILTCGRDYSFIFRANIAPTLEIIEPDGDLDYADHSFLIKWHDRDPDDNATINFYYASTLDSNPIAIWEAFHIKENNEEDQFLWNTSSISGGSYFIRAWIEDGINPRVWAHSPGMVTINHHPTIEITVPNISNNIADENFAIVWNDYDIEDNATISLYYDTDNLGNDGILIIENINEDDDLDMFTWNTTEIPDGTYFIYAEIDDTINPIYTNYSSIPLIIHHKVPILNITNIECKPSSPKEGELVEISATILNSGDKSGRNIVIKLIIDNILIDEIIIDEILPNKNTFKVTFDPINLKQGRHTIMLKMEYDDKEVIEDEILEVKNELMNIYFLILLLIIITIIFIMGYFVYKKRKNRNTQE